MMNIREAINYLCEEENIPKIIRYYQKSSNIKDCEVNIPLIERIIHNLYSSETGLVINDKPFDIGLIYKKEVSYSKRKKLGEIYTPQKVVEFILDECGFQPNKNIENQNLIDLSCGSGSFLITAIQRKITFYLKRFNKKAISELRLSEAQQIIHDIKDNIYGIDINPTACIIAQINFHIQLFKLYKQILIDSNDFKPPQYNIYNLNSLRVITDNFFDLPREFDYVVGNPPYLFIRNIPKNHKNIIQSNKFMTNTGQYDYFQIFLELGIKFLRDGGKLGYIIPDSLLALSNRRIIRKLIYETSKIEKIHVVGPQFENSIVSNIILILIREKNEQSRQNNFVQVAFHNSASKKTNNIVQKQIQKWNYRFLINLNQKDIDIIDYLNNKFYSLGLITSKKDYQILLNRGVELTKEGQIFYCQSCDKYYPIPNGKRICNFCGTQFNKNSIEDIILDEIPESADKKDYLPYIYSMKRYKITQYKYINIKKKGIQYKNLEDYKGRIIIRQISQDGLICGAYDPNISLCSQSFYNLKIIKSALSEFNNFYLLGLINSFLLSYYFLKSFGSYKQLFPRILIEKIRTLPIKIPENQEERAIAQNIIKNVQNLLGDTQTDLKNLSLIQHKINHFVYSLYGLEDHHSRYIDKAIK
ncbi:MAG: N-6 DNA methylase [Candidatus Lokiarchaeota archaeon]|nr:N-6 DNA methylase [Candidatus Lokiarchaeota archaeon]